MITVSQPEQRRGTPPGNARGEAGQRRLEARRAQIRGLDEVSRERQRFQAMKAEAAVRGTAAATAAREEAVGRPRVARAIAHLAQAHDTTAKAGWSLDDPRRAGKVALLGGEGAPVAVLNPQRALARGQAHLLPARRTCCRPG
ncbi:hypothetical protein [Kitasatospora sp. NPDC056731]|uniref:hypothetical protein n=1 Tax=Kitasatospora sp. NPDC056731 TaxID=3155422 RepID=UPI00344472C8